MTTPLPGHRAGTGTYADAARQLADGIRTEVDRTGTVSDATSLAEYTSGYGEFGAGYYASCSARALDEAARHFEENRVLDGVRELGTAARRIRLYISTRQAAADETAGRTPYRGRDAAAGRENERARTAEPFAAQADALYSAAAAAWPQPAPSWPRTVRLITNDEGHPVQWAVVSSQDTYQEILAHADRLGLDVRDHPLPDFLASIDSRTVTEATQRGWDVTYRPWIGVGGTLAVKVEAASRDREEYSEEVFRGREFAVTAAAAGASPGPAGGVPVVFAALGARALLCADYATQEGLWETPHPEISQYLRAAAGHLDDGRPDRALPQFLAATRAAGSIEHDLATLAARFEPGTPDAYATRADLTTARLLAALTAQLDGPARTACGAAGHSRAAPARPRRQSPGPFPQAGPPSGRR